MSYEWKHDPGTCAIVDQGGGDVALVCRFDIAGKPLPDWEARAHLLAAAPFLLDALEEAERVIRWAAQEATGRVQKEIVGGWIHHADIARDVIATARGK